MGFKSLDNQALKRIKEVMNNCQGGSSDNNSAFDEIKEFDDENINPDLVKSKSSKKDDNEKRNKVENIRMVG